MAAGLPPCSTRPWDALSIRRLAAGQVYTTVDMTVSFVRPVFENTGKLRCEGKIIHAGSRIATAEGRVWDDAGTLIAHGSETCLVMTDLRHRRHDPHGIPA